MSQLPLPGIGDDHRPRKGGHGHQAVHLLPWAHTVFGKLKTWLTGTFHGVSPKHLQRERAADLLRPIAQDPHAGSTKREAAELLKEALP